MRPSKTTIPAGESAGPNEANQIFNWIWKWKPVLTFILGLIAGIYSVVAWVERSAQNAVLSASFLNTLAAKVRPTRLFASDRTIEYDSGTQDYIENINVVPDPKISGFEIYIKGKRLISNEPLLTCLNFTLAQQRAYRTSGEEYGWTIVMAPQQTYSSITDGTPMDLKAIYRFKLEILP